MTERRMNYVLLREFNYHRMDNNKIIKSFTVNGLFGTTDLVIPFEDKAKILIGENGLGKTQVLNMLYYTLTKKFEKLFEYAFDSIIIEFEDNEKVQINKSDVEKLLFDHALVKEVIEVVGISQYMAVKNALTSGRLSATEFRNHSVFQKIMENLPISPKHLLNSFGIFNNNFQDNLFTIVPKEKQRIIDGHLKDYQILYFPTYRRVEEDLRNLGYDEEDFGINREDARLIHFGMDDVDKRFKELTQSIERLSKDGLSKISSEILSQLVKGLPPIDDNFLNSINEQDIEIILARVGNQITVEDKTRIKNIVTTREIQEKDHSLLYFLQKLIDIYDQQRELDNSIKKFRDVCNKYLINKKIIYDESSIDIYVKFNDSADKLQLSKLSSGEKQIISIFSKIYLAPPECKFLVLFDEPELSLSIFWQKELLPDIFNSGKCQFLLAVTHSPFIFDNNLDRYAIELSQYLKPAKLVEA
jgi:ABC-type lipoprotein export system ATPase subunit